MLAESDNGANGQTPPRGHSVDVALEALAEAQHGPFTTGQAVEAGLTRRAVAYRAEARRLFKVHHNVYSLVPPRLLTPLGVRHAAVLAGGPGAGLSHVIAGIHTGFLTGLDPQVLDITVPSLNGRSRPGLRIHRSSTLRPQDIERVYGIPTTTVARTILDLTGVLTAGQVDDVIDEAARQELLVMSELREQIDHNRARPEAARLKAIVDLWDAVNALTDSQLEKLTRPVIASLGIPEPELQQWLDLGDGGPRIRADFLWRAERLIGEADSRRWHGHRLERDTRRDQRAARAGFRTFRMTRRQVLTQAARVGESLLVVYAECRAAAVTAGRLAA